MGHKRSFVRDVRRDYGIEIGTRPLQACNPYKPFGAVANYISGNVMHHERCMVSRCVKQSATEAVPYNNGCSGYPIRRFGV